MHPSCLVLKPAAGPCHAGPVRPSYRQVFWLLDQSTPGAFPGHPSPQWLQPVSSPITAAGPRRFCTVFPLTCKCFYSIPFRPGGSREIAPRPNTKALTSTPRAWATGAEESAPGRSDYIACFDILLLRGHERLIEKTEDLVRKTRWIAFATWAVAGVTIIIAILARP